MGLDVGIVSSSVCRLSLFCSSFVVEGTLASASSVVEGAEGGVPGRLSGVTGSLCGSLDSGLTVALVRVVVGAVGVEHLSMSTASVVVEGGGGSSRGKLGGESTQSSSSSLTDASDDSWFERCKLCCINKETAFKNMFHNIIFCLAITFFWLLLWPILSESFHFAFQTIINSSLESM